MANTFQVVLSSGGAAPGKGAFSAPPSGTANYTLNPMSYGIQPTGPVKTVTWQAIDNIRDLPKFNHIEMQPGPGNDVTMIIGGSNEQGLVRLQIFLTF